MNPQHASLDAIALEILSNALRSVTDEAFIALMKSAYSTNIKERRDHSVTIFDPRGRLMVQAERSMPIHLGSLGGLMEKLLRKYGNDIHEGDIIIANDPHTAGGSHLPDVNMAMPVFHGGQLVGFVCDIAHHADIGGIAPGSMAGGMTEIYQEGLRIPVLKLFTKGELQQDLMDLLLLNVRVPEERRGDYFAQVAACRLGARRLAEVVDSYSVGTLFEAFDQIVARTERRMRNAIAEVPDGVYAFDDVMDDDGLTTTDIPLKLAVTVTGERISFDFTGSAAQVPGNINAPLNATMSSVAFAIKALLDPDVPNNQGVIDCFEIIAAPGSILNATFPSAVAARAHTCQRVIDMVFGALAPATVEQTVGAANGANTTAVFAGTDPRGGNDYVYLETLGGGVGGRFAKDGKDGVQANITNTTNLPVEAIEIEYPLRVEEYGLVSDSGGAGRHRGGLALRRVVRPVGHDCTFNGAGERFRHPPWGIFGGAPGGMGRFVLEDPVSGARTLAPKPSSITVTPAQRIVVETPGAGGYGAPSEREPAAVAEDRASGKFSERYLQTHYGKAGL